MISTKKIIYKIINVLQDLDIELDTTAQAGTTDGDLYAAITDLSWESDVID